MNGVKSIFNHLINSNIFVATCIIVLALSSQILLESKNGYINVFVFFATIFTYNFQRIVRIKNGIAHKRKEWLLNNLAFIYSLITFSGFISLFFFFQFKPNTQILILTTGIISVLYPFGLRKIPFLKIFIISSIWTISSMGLLISENNLPLNSNTILQLFSRFLFVFAITIPFDIRDVKYDKNNIKTIPVLLGTFFSRLIAILSLIALKIISFYQHLYYNLSVNILIAIILCCCFSSVLIIKSDENKDDFYFSFWIESLSIFFYLFLMISLFI
ncbi:MAG: hypothetical protein CMD22_03965 [Flavobacteriales bacterium]|nr:hypothetical protein [Flavobacteriales bacterium]|tara:strand:+ start:2532 stop:3350 length:819 start_codon:yes stop_codon:yes gene_type:complete